MQREVRIVDAPKYIEYDGLQFCRDDKTGYYLNSTIRKRLHRYVWEKEVGTIPKGFHVHHLNGDKSDNRIENLALMNGTGHLRMHMQEADRKEKARASIKKAVLAAPAWHCSEAGKAWHSEHAKGIKPVRIEKVCEVCGKIFMGTKPQRFCTNACKAKYRRDNKLDDTEHICEVCGKLFRSNRFKVQKYCSRECASIGHIGWYERWENERNTK